MSAPRVAFSGSAGTGKTTLARALAGHLGVPFIEEGMRQRIEAGFRIYELDDSGRREVLRELWTEQREAEDLAIDGFVSDRSSIDYAAFWLHYNLVDAEAETAAFVHDMVERARLYDRIALCPWGALPLAADGVRSTNRWLQLRFQALVEGLHKRWTPEARLISVPEAAAHERRLAALVGALEDI